MSRVFQVVRGICHYDATRIYPDVASVPDGIYSADVIFIDAPDYVREGWGYDGENFIEPIPPEGWLYDRETGTFYENPDYVPPEQVETEIDDMLAALEVMEVTVDG